MQITQHSTTEYTEQKIKNITG